MTKKRGWKIKEENMKMTSWNSAKESSSTQTWDIIPSLWAKVKRNKCFLMVNLINQWSFYLTK